ncbi:DUF177 domain-containing protein [Thalassospira sp.]|uniref:YceD family protein n=1 Tax=Thalassospira sp. TaxID=1912094 RepID=UPI002733B3DA|nr:DUF177 domain-containing protein [Thalassospira sp.]MDP2697875.1 DUF177 domain-containing protein [Thalassospira sp.]
MSKNITPEFSRIVRIDELTEKKNTIELESNAAERAALAKRFDLIDLSVLNAKLKLTINGNGEVAVRGTLHAEIAQKCVVTLDPVPEVIDDEIEVLFSPHVSESDLPSSPDDLENLSEEELMALLDQPEPLVDGRIDLGEIVAQYLAVAMNPYPRKEGAEAPVQLADNDEDEKPNPFAKLAALKDKLEPKG